MGIRIASRPSRPSRPAYIQPQHYPQANPMYMAIPPQTATSPPLLHQERPYYTQTHAAMNVHDYGLLASSASMSMVPASENAPSQFVRDIGGIKDPILNRGQVFSFLGNKQSTPYHYIPYSEEEIQWGNKGSSSSHPNHGSSSNGGNSSPQGESQASSPTSSVSSEPSYQRKDSRRDIAKSIKITSYKHQDDSDDDTEENHSVIRKVTLSSTDSRSFSSSDKNSSHRHEREHSNEDRHNRSRQSSSGSGDRESSYIIRQSDFYIPDYEKRPLPPRAALTGRKRQRNRSVSPDRHRSNRNTSRSPTRQTSRSTINDRLNLSQVNNAPTASTSTSTNGSSHSRENSEGATTSTLYQNKTWVNPSEKLPLSKKFTSKEPESTDAHKSYNKIWVKPTEDRDLRFKDPIASTPLPSSKKFSPGAPQSPNTESAKPKANKQKNAAVPTKPTAAVQPKVNSPKTNVTAKPVFTASNNNTTTTTKAAAATTTTTTPIINGNHSAAKPVAKPVANPAVNSAVKSVANPAVNTAVKSVAKPIAKPIAKPVAKPIAKPVAKPVAMSVIKPVAMPVVKPAVKPVANPAASASTASTIESDIKPSSKEPASCSKTINGILTNNTMLIEQKCVIKEEPDTKEMKLSDFKENNGMDVDSIQTGLPQEDATMEDVSSEKRLSDPSDVSELIQSKKRRVSPENGVVNESPIKDDMEVDSVQNNAESTCSSSVTSFATAVSDTNGTINKKADQANSPMVIVTTNSSSNHQLHVSAKKTIPSRSSTAVNPTIFEKEDILEQIFGDGYSRDATPEVTKKVNKTSTDKSGPLKEGNIGNHGNSVQEQDTTVADKTTCQPVEKNQSPTKTIAVNPSEAKTNINTMPDTPPKKETEPPKSTHDTKPIKTNTSPPPTTSARKKSRRLPPPWIARMSDTGDIFYFNTETLESSDIRPVS
jgi:hypothetical protein